MKRLRSPALAFALLVGPTGCAERDILHHTHDGGGGGSADETLTERGGNFPEPAVTLCGTLPEGVDPIPGLTAAWAAESTFTSFDGPPSYPGIRLRFSDWGFTCDERLPNVADECQDSWSFALTLPIDLAPGVYDLTEVSGLAFEETFTFGDRNECGGSGGGDGGYDPHDSPGGELEIFFITDDCIAGELRDLDLGQGDPLVEPNGGFVAQRCTSECVPTLAHRCDE